VLRASVEPVQVPPGSVMRCQETFRPGIADRGGSLNI
jgi:hypothetical protein